MTSALERLTYPQFEGDLSTVYIGLLDNVKNSASLRSRIIAAASAQGTEGDLEREAVNFAFIDARTIASREHLMAAIYVALVAASHNHLTTKTAHSEILWALNYSNNITESIRRFGVNDKSGALVVVRVGEIDATTKTTISPSDMADRVIKVVEGDWKLLDDVSSITDWVALRKYYKLASDPAVVARQGGSDERCVMNEIVVSAVAMKSVLS